MIIMIIIVVIMIIIVVTEQAIHILYEIHVGYSSGFIGGYFASQVSYSHTLKRLSLSLSVYCLRISVATDPCPSPQKQETPLKKHLSRPFRGLDIRLPS